MNMKVPPLSFAHIIALIAFIVVAIVYVLTGDVPPEIYTLASAIAGWAFGVTMPDDTVRKLNGAWKNESK